MAERPLSHLARLRENVALRVAATSLPEVARQVGMSPAGLERFLAGGTPLARSRQKLEEWYDREGGRPAPDVTAAGVEVALGAMLRDLPGELRPQATGRMVGVVCEVYCSAGVPAPPWLRELSRRFSCAGAVGAGCATDDEG